MEKLKPIECKWNVVEYTEKYGDIEIDDRVAISVRESEKEIMEDIELNDRHTISMSKAKYKTIFKPLFEAISQMNQQIREIKNRTCDGCKYEEDCPSHVKCHGCARMYNDNFERV